jgi:RNA polymerase sigma factor (sigma-70 family)
VTRRAAPAPYAWQIAAEEDRWLGQLARATQRGDKIARDMLWDAIGHRLVSLARRSAWFLPEPEREDIAQEAFPLFLTLVQEWDKAVTADTGFARYLFGVFRVRIRNIIRDGMRAYALAPTIARGAVAMMPDERSTAHGLEDAVDLASFLASLSRHEQRILHLRTVEGVPMEQIAARLGVTPRSISRTWNSVLRRFRWFIAT